MPTAPSATPPTRPANSGDAHPADDPARCESPRTQHGRERRDEAAATDDRRTGGTAGSTIDPQLVRHWERFKHENAQDARDHLVTHYMRAHVRPIALRVYAGLPAQVELDDLLQQGYIGLVDAMHRYDPARNVRFETFSRRRIYGALQDYLREIDSVPRIVRQRARLTAALAERFGVVNGRPPFEEELLGLIPLPADEARRTLDDANVAATIAFSGVQPETGPAQGSTEVDAMDSFIDRHAPCPLERTSNADIQRWILRGLDRRDRLIVLLYYYEEMTMREVGKALGICESRVSQRMDSILSRLRARLDERTATIMLAGRRGE